MKYCDQFGSEKIMVFFGKNKDKILYHSDVFTELIDNMTQKKDIK